MTDLTMETTARPRVRTAGLLHGVRLVARHEFRVRLRTGRWRWLLGAWVAVVAVFTALLHLALLTTDTAVGTPLFGGLMLFVLGLVLVVSPALTAQSINGDRERGTLATLQVTRLAPVQIAVGKLVAAWGVGLAALALTAPFVIWAVAQGGVGVVRVVAVIIVVALLIGVVCAVSQALSALLSRSITSALMSYVVMFALTVGTLIAFGLSVPLTTETIQVSDNQGSTWEEQRAHTERVWWLLAPNPFVVLADAAPTLPPPKPYESRPLDPLGEVGRGVRNIRQGEYVDGRGDKPVWPYGLGFDLLLGAGGVWVTTRRLRAPAHTLAKGVRIA
jgi:ABC-type transport system involved in multi-copper enzyme maturation permease subunit